MFFILTQHLGSGCPISRAHSPRWPVASTPGPAVWRTGCVSRSRGHAMGGRQEMSLGWGGPGVEFVQGLGRFDAKMESIRSGSHQCLTREEKAAAEDWASGERDQVGAWRPSYRPHLYLDLQLHLCFPQCFLCSIFVCFFCHSPPHPRPCNLKMYVLDSPGSPVVKAQSFTCRGGGN